jgi:hypothetical protein
MHAIKALFLSGFFFFSGACQAWVLPQYWLCQGSNQQSVRVGTQDPSVFSGSDPVLLEVFQGHVFQFFAAPLAGANLIFALLLTIIVSTLFAFASFHLVELPFVLLKKKQRARVA